MWKSSDGTDWPSEAKILLVDDDGRKRAALAAALGGLSENVAVARSGADALRMLLKDDFAVILLDVRMPDMDGIETARMIRGRDSCKHIPIIFVSSYVQEECDMLQGYALGAVDFIFTPIIPEILRAKVSVFLDLFEKTQTIKRYGQQLESLVEQRTADLKAEIAEHLDTQDRLSHLAHHDVLTGLPNRLQFVDHLQQALERSRRHGRIVAVMFLDTDRFKVVNDTMGHQAGDELLKAMSSRLLSCVRPGDTVGRFGGDEFALLFNDVASADDVAPIALKLLAALRPPFRINGRRFFSTGSVGISLYPADGEDADSLLKHADIAMYRAKENGGNSFRFYEASMHAHALQRLELETELRLALERNEFVLHYQPQYDLHTGRMSGVEALIRWDKPGVGLVPPLTFIPALEDTGLIVPVGEWALRTACDQHRAWCADGLPPDLRIAVNVSGKQCDSGRLAETVLKAVRQNGIRPECLEIEITESTLMKNAQLAAAQMREMNEAGVRFAIDDFGIGYSSLSHLKRFPINILKIDQTFVRDITRDPDDAAIVGAIITMAHALGIKVVAEGVETRDQLDFLKDRDCDYAQGYLMSRPIPGDQLKEFSETWPLSSAPVSST
ncbi:MAG: Response regulator receiver protein [Herminiimonas sp.]|nr:Response regulator receiver protein [Herminiimonas sp.]